MLSGIMSLMNLPTASSIPVSGIMQSKNLTPPQIPKKSIFLPLEDGLTRYYFNITSVLPLSKEDISTLGKRLRKMLVLDPIKRVQVRELFRDLWFTRGAKKDASDSLVHETDSVVRDGGKAHSLPRSVLLAS